MCISCTEDVCTVLSKPLTFSVFSFALSSARKIFMLMIYARCLHNFVIQSRTIRNLEQHAVWETVPAMEMYQSCEEPCFADAAVQKLSQILRRSRHKSFWT